MTLSEPNNTISVIVDILSVASCVLIFVVLFADKKLSSMSIVLIVFCIGEGFNGISLPHLRNLSGLTADYSYAGWYLGWMFQFIVWLVLLLKLHQHLRIHLSNMALLIAWYYTTSIIIQAVDFIDRLTVNSGAFSQIYQLYNLYLSLLIIPIVGIVYWHELYKRRVLTKMQEA